MKSAVFLVMSLAVSAAFAEKHPITRYQSIIDRQMFGPLPPGFDPTKSPNEVQKTTTKEEKQLAMEQEKLQSSIHFSVINVAADGQPAVGFTDNSDPKAPKHYFLKVGETKDGWTVKEADADKATMTIEKGEIEVTLTLGGNSASGGGTSRAGGASSAAAAANGGARAPRSLGGGLFGGGSLRARRLQRQQEAQAEAAKRQAEQAAREAERQAQAEADKQQREQERAEQRQQLLAIQEELKRVREQKAAAAKNENGNEGGANNEAE